ncbi:MAG TPA: acyltransferase, partial [Candidatus Saccharimonadales bacterium]|nr:acyltransferase [Candidatus Saccharimonadales bacterium]
MRKDIQGLRAIAVLAVLLYHFWPSRLTGGYVGVDIFFVISGFLITGHLLKKPPVTAHKLADFWARRIKRLLPAASFVLLVTLVAGLAWLPDTMTHTLLKETASAAVYVENWTLASTATDYLSSQNAPSPIQHFWSLSVEEQFYMIWPLLIGGAFLLSKRLKQGSKKLVWFGLSGLFAASLAYSVYLTKQDPAAAYFVTPTRMWELSLGGLVAFLSTYEIKRITGYMSASIAWAGLIMIAASLLFFTEKTSFPGYTALLPTLGTALVILAAADGVKWSPGRLLGLKISQFFGDISYSLYLWHWPLLIIAPYALGFTPHASVKLALIALAVALSALMKRFIEDPVRFHPIINRRKLITYGYGFASMAVVVAASFGTLQYKNVAQAHAVAQINHELNSGSNCLGAAAMKNKDCTPMGRKLITPSSFAKTDKPDVYSDGCWSLRP